MLYLFDIDGTLMTSDGLGGRSFEWARFEILGIERALAEVTLHGNTDPTILEEACQHRLGRSPTAAEADRVIALYLRYLEEELAQPGIVTVLPGVREALAQLDARGALIGLATGNVEEGAKKKLSAAGLWERFRFGGYGSDSALRAELVAVAIARAEKIAGRVFDRSEVWVIGDTPRDIAAARAVGARAVGVATGMHDVATLAAAGADEAHETLESFRG